MKFSKLVPFSAAILLFAACSKDSSTDTTPTPTNTSAPTIVSMSPANNSTGTTRNTTVSVTFSTAMNASTINSSTFVVKQSGVVVPGTVSTTGAISTYTPATSLLSLAKYTVSLSTDIKNQAGIALASGFESSFTTASTTTGQSVINLGEAANFVILAKTAISNSPTSQITGDIGISPAATTYITGFSLTNSTGFATSSQVTGKIYAADMASPTPATLTTSINNMATAYNNAAALTTPDYSELSAGNIGGQTLLPGLYKWTSTVSAPTSLTIAGGANDVWIFQIAGNLTIASAVNITLTGGAQAKNIFWQVAGAVTIGSTAHVEGNILSMTGISFGTGASLKGRALAQTSVVMDSNTITKP